MLLMCQYRVVRVTAYTSELFITFLDSPVTALCHEADLLPIQLRHLLHLG